MSLPASQRNLASRVLIPISVLLVMIKALSVRTELFLYSQDAGYDRIVVGCRLLARPIVGGLLDAAVLRDVDGFQAFFPLIGIVPERLDGDGREQ